MPSNDRVTDTSVSVSLADLTRIEQERIQREQIDRERARADRLREQREAEARRLAEERARAEAEAEARAARAREQTIEKARLEARERAAADVRRIEAEAKVRLQAEDAQRAHELAVLRARLESGRRRREWLLGAALAIVLCAAGLGSYRSQQRLSELERTAQELHERERALGEERDGARRTELAAHDRRHASLLSRPAAKHARDALDTAAEARAELRTDSPGHDGLRRFADSLDALESRIGRTEALAALDRRHADLAAWAASLRKTAAGERAATASRRARAPGAGSDALDELERSLDDLSRQLAARAGSGTRRVEAEPVASGGRSCSPGDPGCGLDGRPLF